MVLAKVYRLVNIKASEADMQSVLAERTAGAAELDFPAFLSLCQNFAERLVPSVDNAIAILQKKPAQRSATELTRLSRCAISIPWQVLPSLSGTR